MNINVNCFECKLMTMLHKKFPADWTLKITMLHKIFPADWTPSDLDVHM